MMGVPGIAARTFRSVTGVGTNVLMISQSSSEQSICFVVPDNSAPAVIEALRTEFKVELERKYIDDISGLTKIAIVAVVGSGMRGTRGWRRASSRVGEKHQRDRYRAGSSEAKCQPGGGREIRLVAVGAIPTFSRITNRPRNV